MSTLRSENPSVIPSDRTGTQRNPEYVLGSENQPSGYSNLVGQELALKDKTYKVIQQLSSSGEAEIFLVESNGAKVVLKYYFSNYKLKDDIIRKLQALKRPDILSPLDTGMFQNRFYELTEYMAGGTLDEVIPLRDIVVFKGYISQISDALEACHKVGIIHRDIKPSNILFRSPTREQLVLGDFGIASSLQDGSNYRFTNNVNRTNSYAAPELFTNINNKTTLDVKVDYYALGISLLELWLGDDPFRDVAEFVAMRFKIEGSINMPKDLDANLKNIIRGLLVTEPPKRWGHMEITKWLRGESVKVEDNRAEQQYKPYEWDRLNNVIVDNPKALADRMEEEPLRALKQLYSRAIPDWIKNNSADLYSEVNYIVEQEYPNTSQSNSEAGVIKTIYLLDPKRVFKSLDGVACNSFKEIALNLLQNHLKYQQALSQKSASLYLFLQARGFHELAAKYYTFFQNYSAKKALNLIILDLDDFKLNFSNEHFETINQLMLSNDNILDELVRQLIDAESLPSLWIDIVYPNLVDSLAKWRNDTPHRNTETLHYALQTGGIKINGEELLTPADFYQTFRKNAALFFVGTDAAILRERAQYWLKTYKAASFNAFSFNYIEQETCDPELFRSILDHLLKNGESNLLNIVKDLVPVVKRHTEGDSKAIQECASIIHRHIENYLVSGRRKRVYSLENIKEILLSYSQLSSNYNPIIERLLNLGEKNIQTEIDFDQNRIAGNSESFYAYRKELASILSGSEKMTGSTSFYQHWQAEEKKIEAAKAGIDSKMSGKEALEIKAVDEQFTKFAKAKIAAGIDFIGAGRTFFLNFFLVIGITVLYFTAVYFWFLFKYMSPDGVLIAAGIAFIPFLMVLWRNKTKRSAFSPGLCQIIGKVVYFPLLRKGRSKIGSQDFADIELQKAAELEKLKMRNEGMKLDELFEESVRIVQMSSQDLFAKH